MSNRTRLAIWGSTSSNSYNDFKGQIYIFFDYIGKVVAFFFSNISVTTSTLNK